MPLLTRGTSAFPGCQSSLLPWSSYLSERNDFLPQVPAHHLQLSPQLRLFSTSGVTGSKMLVPPNSEQLDTSEAQHGSQQGDSKLQSPFRKMETALQVHMERGVETCQKKKTQSAAFEDRSGQACICRATASQMSC